MPVEHQFETETMAQIYAEQGHYTRAAAIYRRLLDAAPQREDLRRRLAAIEARRQQKGGGQLSERFGEWIQLLLKKKQIDRLRRFRHSR